MQLQRKIGYDLLNGKGLEIGALHEPAELPKKLSVSYADAITKAEAMALFPEIDATKFTNPEYIINLDHNGLSQFENEKFDFVILSHVIEHVANPVNVIKELFRITKRGGHIVIACPDKRYTPDINRPITTVEHLWKEYEEQITEVSDEHYIDFLKYVHPEVYNQGGKVVSDALLRVRNRREHSHVWDSNAFKNLLQTTIHRLNLGPAFILWDNKGESNYIEYFAVIKKENNDNRFLLNLKKAYLQLYYITGMIIKKLVGFTK